MKLLVERTLLNMPRFLLFTVLVCSFAMSSVLGAQIGSPQIDPSKVKLLMGGCGSDMWSQLRVMGVVADDIDLSDDNTAKAIIKLAKTFAKETCPNRKDFLIQVYLWRGDPATFRADRFKLTYYDVMRDIGNAYKESNDYGGYSQYNEAVRAFGPVSVAEGRYENRVKSFKERQAAAAVAKKAADERRAKEKQDAESRAREQEARAAVEKKLNDERRAREKLAADTAKRMRVAAQVAKTEAFMKRAGTKQIVSLGDLCQNPFPYQGKVVIFRLMEMWEWQASSPTSAVIHGIGLACGFAMSGIRADLLTQQFNGAKIIAVKVLGRPQGTLLVQYVYHEQCSGVDGGWCGEFAGFQ